MEFARELEFEGRTPLQAAIEASRLRLRPILMTSLAFIMGVVPLVVSTGAGAEMRAAMGVAVFSGMIGVTFFGIFMTPVFYVLVRKLAGNRPLIQHKQEEPANSDYKLERPADTDTYPPQPSTQARRASRDARRFIWKDVYAPLLKLNQFQVLNGNTGCVLRRTTIGKSQYRCW